MNDSEKTKTDQLRKMFHLIGTPFHPDFQPDLMNGKEVDNLFEFSFENRVGLLLLQKCVDYGIELTDTGWANYRKLNERRINTEKILVKITQLLEPVCPGGWAMFKTVKPFPSTPNDTDWFPFDESLHTELCDHLLKSGFSFLEQAPLQTTLIDDSGVGLADSDKRGGVWYIDCYRAPGADYFKYLDPAKMKRHLVYTEVQGVKVPNLASPAELAAICYHNVFPERTYSVESFYLILHYLKDIEDRGLVEDFIETVNHNFMRRAVSANLYVTRAMHLEHFGTVPAILERLISIFNTESQEEGTVAKDNYYLPYNFNNSCFWSCFFEKLKDPISFRSIFVQAFHMLNPVFAWGALKIIWQRTRPGSIYKQM